MSLRDTIAADVSRVFMQARDFATESVLYTVEGETTSLTAIVFDEQTAEEITPSGRRLHTFRDVQIGRDPAAACGGVEHPRNDATIAVGGVKYAVQSIPYLDDETATLRVVRVESIERSRAKYRG